jgi:hypothetical protein
MRHRRSCWYVDSRSYWYVSNVSIIFDAPRLFLHHLLCVLLHFVAFYAFSETNLLTRCHSASSLFSAIFVFQKSYTGNILGIGRNKSQTSYFYRSFAKTEDETEGGQELGSPPGVWRPKIGTLRIIAITPQFARCRFGNAPPSDSCICNMHAMRVESR